MHQKYSHLFRCFFNNQTRLARNICVKNAATESQASSCWVRRKIFRPSYLFRLFESRFKASKIQQSFYSFFPILSSKPLAKKKVFIPRNQFIFFVLFGDGLWGDWGVSKAFRAKRRFSDFLHFCPPKSIRRKTDRRGWIKTKREENFELKNIWVVKYMRKINDTNSVIYQRNRW